ncbi:hypothetical protein, partial [Caldimonas sp. KR1-144]|uniref:hypothetical protein n=1 Tax=Caldimonas sp. KR1-144 TaxID=3400911 RepID=UPI003C0944B5
MPASRAQAPAASTAAVAEPTLLQLRQLGERGQRDPAGGLVELARWRGRLPVGSAVWLEHLLVTGLLLGDLRRVDALEALLRELDQGAPHDARVRAAGLLVRGNLEREQGDLARAEDVLLSAQEIEPSGPNDYTRLRIAELLTLIYIDRGARESAVSMAQDAVRIVDALAVGLPDAHVQRLRARTRVQHPGAARGRAGRRPGRGLALAQRRGLHPQRTGPAGR